METVRSADRAEIAFHRSGEGPRLVLVGRAFQARSSMKTLAIGLQDAFTVFEYDRRGRGSSGNTAPYAVEREVDDLAAVIEADGEPAFVFGQSSGGALALEAASRAPGGAERSQTPCPPANPGCWKGKPTDPPMTCSPPCSRNSSSSPRRQSGSP